MFRDDTDCLRFLAPALQQPDLRPILLIHDNHGQALFIEILIDFSFPVERERELFPPPRLSISSSSERKPPFEYQLVV